MFSECKGALLLLLLKWVQFGLPEHLQMHLDKAEVVDSIVRSTVEGLVNDGLQQGVSAVQITASIANMKSCCLTVAHVKASSRATKMEAFTSQLRRLRRRCLRRCMAAVKTCPAISLRLAPSSPFPRILPCLSARSHSILLIGENATCVSTLRSRRLRLHQCRRMLAL